MVGGVGVVEVDGKPKAGYTIHRHRDRATVSSVRQRNSLSAHVKTVVGSNLTPHAALLVCPSGTTSAVNRHEFAGSEMLPVKADLAIFSPVFVVS